MAFQLEMDQVKVHYNSKRKPTLQEYVNKVMNGPPPFLVWSQFIKRFAEENDISLAVARLDPVARRMYKKYSEDEILPDMANKSTYVQRSILVNTEFDNLTKFRSREVQIANLLNRVGELLDEVADLRMKLALSATPN